MDVANHVFRKASHQEPLQPGQSVGAHDDEVNVTFCRNFFDRLRGIPFCDQVFDWNPRGSVRGALPEIFLEVLPIRFRLRPRHPLTKGNVFGAKRFDGMEHEHSGITKARQVDRDSKSVQRFFGVIGRMQDQPRVEHRTALRALDRDMDMHR